MTEDEPEQEALFDCKAPTKTAACGRARPKAATSGVRTWAGREGREVMSQWLGSIDYDEVRSGATDA